MSAYTKYLYEYVYILSRTFSNEGSLAAIDYTEELGFIKSAARFGADIYYSHLTKSSSVKKD